MKTRVLFFTVCIIIFGKPNASGQAPIIQTLRPNHFLAETSSLSFYYVEEIAGRQRCPNWCWAASCQMVLNFYGLYISQEQIAKKIFGSLECKRAADEDILGALTGWAADTKGKYSEIYSEEESISQADIVKKLSNQSPLIVVLNNPDGSGHAEVMTGVFFSLDQYNNPIIDEVVLRDPWPFYPSRQVMPWHEFSNRVRNIFRVWVVKQ